MKPTPHFTHAMGHLFRVQVQADARRLQGVSAAGLAGNRAVAVFGHVTACRRGHEHGCGGDIEGAGSIATGAHDIHGIIQAGDIHPGRQLAHHRGGRSDFRHCLPLHAQADEKAADLRRGGAAGHDGSHDGCHLLRAQILLVYNPVYGLFHVHGSCLCNLGRSDFSPTFPLVPLVVGLKPDLHILRAGGVPGQGCRWHGCHRQAPRDGLTAFPDQGHSQLKTVHHPSCRLLSGRSPACIIFRRENSAACHAHAR